MCLFWWWLWWQVSWWAGQHCRGEDHHGLHKDRGSTQLRTLGCYITQDFCSSVREGRRCPQKDATCCWMYHWLYQSPLEREKKNVVHNPTTHDHVRFHRLLLYIPGLNSCLTIKGEVTIITWLVCGVSVHSSHNIRSPIIRGWNPLRESCFTVICVRLKLYAFPYGTAQTKWFHCPLLASDITLVQECTCLS